MGFLRAARSAPLSGDRSGQTFRAWIGQVEKAHSPSPVWINGTFRFGASVLFDAPHLSLMKSKQSCRVEFRKAREECNGRAELISLAKWVLG